MKYATVFQRTREGTSFYCHLTKLQKQIFACQRLQIINEQYQSQLEQIIKETKATGEVDVTGDGRCNSPITALYLTCTVLWMPRPGIFNNTCTRGKTGSQRF